VSPSPPQPALRVVSDRGPASLEELYRRYSPYVAAVVVRVTGRRTDVEDVVQDVFVEAAAGIGRLRDPGAAKGWLATVAVRLTRRRLQARRVRRLLGLDRAFDYAQVADPAASPADRLLLVSVYRLLDELPVGERLAFCLHQLEGEKIADVARLTGCSSATTKRRIARVAARLREVFGDE
jgi:RNA polymerase sigma-70 factor (ECF subfamily)